MRGVCSSQEVLNRTAAHAQVICYCIDKTAAALFSLHVQRVVARGRRVRVCGPCSLGHAVTDVVLQHLHVPAIEAYWDKHIVCR
jgi:hypothetical protein